LPNQLALRLLRHAILDPELSKLLARPLAAVAIANDFGCAIGLEQLHKLRDYSLRREWRPALVHGVQHGHVSTIALFAVGDREVIESELPPDGSTKAT
jgi:hypothetical protein